MFNAEQSTQTPPFAALGFGEVMLRLSPPKDERISKGNEFHKHAGGTEINVMSGISRLGLRTGIISSLPDSPVGTYIRNQIRSYGVSDDFVVTDSSPSARLGLYYYESGGYPRKPKVTYDRANSSFTFLRPDDIPAGVTSQAALFHLSGVTLTLGGGARQTAIDLLRRFHDAGVPTSFDVNYRATLWSELEARQVIQQVLPYVSILFVADETSRRTMNRTGNLTDIQRGYCSDFGISMVASTQRTIITPHNHHFTSQLYIAEEDATYTEPPYENIEVADRIGSGDAYVAGVLYAYLTGKTPAEAVSYGNAMGALKNTVAGDLINTDLAEIESIIADHRDGSTEELVR